MQNKLHIDIRKKEALSGKSGQRISKSLLILSSIVKAFDLYAFSSIIQHFTSMPHKAAKKLNYICIKGL